MRLFGIKNKWLRWIIGIITGFLGLIAVCLVATYFYLSHLLNKTPNRSVSTELTQLKPVLEDDSTWTIGPNYLRKVQEGFYVLYVEGNPSERGATIGALVKDLHTFQEDAFVNQLKQMIPNDRFLSFLKYFIAYFNRDIENYIPEEYKEEIFAESCYLSSKYDQLVGSPYVRILNYHAAHDIGHALQDRNFVAGCTSLALWGDKTEHQELLVGRNFDFYVGDDFAKNKIVLAMKPDSGQAFAMVTWPGMIGAVSGINADQLTVTINASKSDMPLQAKTPISILSRQILQYARTIDEAIALAQKTELFVSESILTTSGKEKRAVIIEKSPSQMSVYQATDNWLTCANHFQSSTFQSFLPQSQEGVVPSSIYRQQRLEELVAAVTNGNIDTLAAILRNPYGINNTSIGWGNEKAMNQLIAHHAIILKPEKKEFWVSTQPYQLGAFLHFNLDSLLTHNKYILDPVQSIPADDRLLDQAYKPYSQWKAHVEVVRKAFKTKTAHNLSEQFIQEIIHLNPANYESHELAGDYYANKNLIPQAIEAYQSALRCEIPNPDAAVTIHAKIKKLTHGSSN